MKYRHFLSRLQETINNCWEMKALTNYGKNSFTYKEVAENIEKYHILFKKIGLKKGDKIAISAGNSAEWAIAFISITTYQAIAVPMLNEFTDESIQHLIEHCESSVFITDTNKWKNIDSSALSFLHTTIDITTQKVIYSKSGNTLVSKKEVEDIFCNNFNNNFSKEDVNYPTENFNEIAVINYTSGTTSEPKGVMLTYGSISSNIEFANDLIPNTPGETIISMLPMAHMYGLTFEFLYPFCGGINVVFLGKIPSPAILLNAFAEIKPYILITVPLVIEKIFQKSVIPELNKPIIKYILKTPFKSLIYLTIRKKILKSFGNNIRHIVAGGAPMNKSIEKLLRICKLPYTIGYGMTECAPLLAYEDWRKFAKGSCGKPTHRMEVRIDSKDPLNIDGEIQVKGENVMVGYFKNEKATKAAFTQDGWLKTGDLGHLDKENNIFIKGRSKNMLLSSSGQNIYPEEIEDTINSEKYVLESIVLQRNNIIIALIVPSLDSIKLDGYKKDQISEIMENIRIKINKKLPSYSKIQKIEIQEDEFIKTPKRSIKRFLYQ